MRRAILLCAALADGAMLSFAFAPYGFYFLAFVSLALWLLMLRGSSARGAIAISYAYGLGMFGAGVWWIQISVHQFGLPLYSFSVSITAAFVAFIALYPAFVGWFVAQIEAFPRTMQTLVFFPAAWTLAEILRGVLFSGFPWLLLGYSQVDSPLAAFAPLVGAYGVSFVVALLAGAATLLFERRRRLHGIAVFGVIALAFTLSQDKTWTRASGEPKSVALVQGAVPQAVKWSRAYRQPSIDLYSKLSRPHWGKSFVVWPETAIPAFAEEVPETMETLNEIATSSDTALFVGLPSGDVNAQSNYYNSVVLLGGDQGRYDKRHLVPFGEYLPFDSWLRPLLDFLHIPMSSFSKGSLEQPIVEANGIAVGISICYEDAYASEVTRALPAAKVLINVSNDAWFGDSIAPHQHLQIARMRALETGRYLLRATNTGISAIIDERGRPLAVSKQFVPDVVVGEFIPHEGRTPAVRYGYHAVTIICTLVCVVGLFLSRRRYARD